MRMLRVVGISVAVILVGTALFGTSAAAAEETEYTVLCATTQESGTCGEEAEDIYPVQTPIRAASTNAVIAGKVLGIPYTVSCEESTLEGETTESSETTELEGTVSSLAFSGCKESIGKSECSVTTENLPFKIAVSRGGESVGNGRLLLWSPSSQPTFDVTCGIGLHCVFKAADELEPESAESSVQGAEFWVLGGSTAQLQVGSAPVTAAAGEGCPGGSAASVSAEYAVAEPVPLFVEETPVGIDLNPDPMKFAKPETINQTITNSSPKTSWKIILLGADPPNFGFKDPNTCFKKSLDATKSCVVPVTCFNAGNKATFQVGYALPWGASGKYVIELIC